jgi:phosphate:Na+ symporter
LAPLALSAMSVTSRDGGHLVANAHTFFNLGLACLFLPLTGPLAAFLERAVSSPRAPVPRGRPVFLDREHLPVAGAALGQVAREIVRMADIIQEMHEDAVEAIGQGAMDRIDRIAKADDDVDELTREIKVFLSTLGEASLDSSQTQRAVAYIAVITDLENIGDFIDKTLADHMRRLAARNLRFSEEGVRELRGYLAEVGSLYREAVSAFVTRDRKAAEIVVERRKDIGLRERELRLAHIRRLQRATPESLETSAAHLDILSSWKGIAAHCGSIAKTVLEEEV